MERHGTRAPLRGRNMRDFNFWTAIVGDPGNEGCGLLKSAVECTIEPYTVRCGCCSQEATVELCTMTIDSAA